MVLSLGVKAHFFPFNIFCLIPVLNLVHNNDLLLFVISSFVSDIRKVEKFHVYVGLLTTDPRSFYNLSEINT